MAKARLVLVHGRAQQGKSEASLIQEWMQPLQQALGARATVLDDVEVLAPFYGDTLAELVGSLGGPVPDDIIVRGNAENLDESYRELLARHLEVVREREGLSTQALGAESGMPVTERGPQNWRWVLAIVRALDRIPGLDGDMIERILRDVWLYLERRSVRQKINAIVEPAFDTDLPMIVVAHSLGTIVTYDILRNRKTGIIQQLITAGSPLSLDIARKALAPIGHPVIVRHWFNARDSRDVVALYPLTKTYFDIDPEITDFSEVRNRTPNAHGIAGYLSDPRTVDCIHNALLDAPG